MEGSALAFRHIGRNVRLHKSVVTVSPENMALGSDIIIDDFVFIGSHRHLIVGNHVHIASHASITGGGRVLISDFCGISSGARLISGSDDFTGGALTGPTIPPEFRQAHRGTIVLEC
jgi:acetyltransferase-like isoleucine patch superfamily enzyme